MFRNTKFNNLFTKFFICSLLVVFIIGVNQIVSAQDNLLLSTNIYTRIPINEVELQVNNLESQIDNEIISQLEVAEVSKLMPLKMAGTIVHAGAVQIGLSSDDVCLSVVKADTFLTIVNPSAPFLVTCSNFPISHFDIVGKVVLYNNNGTYAAHTVFKIPPKGNKTISLAKVLLSNNLDTRSHIKKYTYDIVWYVPKLVSHLDSINCRVPFIPISVEVKEIIYKDWICLSSYLYTNDDQILDDRDILVNRYLSEKVQTMSETILDKSNIIYPILSSISGVEAVATPITETKPNEPPPAVTTPPVTQKHEVPTAVIPSSPWSIPTTGSKLPAWGINTLPTTPFNNNLWF